MVFEDLRHRRALIGHRLRLVVQQQRRHAASCDLQLRSLFIAGHLILVDHAEKLGFAVLLCRKAHGAAQHVRHRLFVRTADGKAVARLCARIGKAPRKQRRQLIDFALAGRHKACHGITTCCPVTM